jgi:hypothetical protein
MTSHPHNPFDSNAAPGSGDAEMTLRLIAGLPAPLGLEERVKAALHQTPRRASLLHWPRASRQGSTRAGWARRTWVRSAAAAAIVFVVAGGGWEVYSRVQPVQEPKAIALPPVAARRGFSSANAIRTPKTLNGTVLTHPLAAQAKPGAGVEKKLTAKKPAGKIAAQPAKVVAP